MTEPLTLCCIKKGTKYGADYVNILASMIRKNVKEVSYEFVCFTEDSSGIIPGVRIEPLPYDGNSWWTKMGLYLPEIPGVHTKRLVFFDLDVVVTGCLDELLLQEEDLMMAKDWPTGIWPKSDRQDRDGNSSVLSIRVGSRAHIWRRYLSAGCPTKANDGDQEWVNRMFPGQVKLMPERFVQSYKLHHLEGETIPDCSVVMFHGEPKPPQCGGWVRRLWVV